MLIVLSPAKTLDYTTPLGVERATRPAMVDDAAELIETLRGYSPADLSRLMGISDPLAQLNAARFEAWRPRFTKHNSRQAILAFAGDVYTGLVASELSEQALEWAQDHVRILSGLYGVLRPLDLMQAYRLEMGSRLKTARGNNLYEFWGERIAAALMRAMPSDGARVLVNLASEEYFRAVDRTRFKASVIQPVFQDWNGGRYRVISFQAKRARGAMTRFAIEHRITDPESLKGFEGDGYRYVAAESGPDTWVFRRRGASA
ncbi:MAG: peroxide stress protein YaaA [Burkholderiaceae bacterium]|nr:peroxide stress protein YaaA [Burkholderiaceae bacterium]